MKNNEILTLLEQINKSATTGKNYAKSHYDLDRYAQIEALTQELYAKIDGFEEVQIDALAEKSYITPKVGVNAIIVNENGEFLLEQRMDDKCWGIPGGWSEVGLTAEENIQKEILEETGFNVEVEKLIGVISRKPNERYLLTSYHLLFKCKIVSGELRKSYESENVAWQKFEDIQNWHADHKEWMKFYFNSI